MTHVSVKLPPPIDLADKRSATISMTTRFPCCAAIATTDHIICYCDPDTPVVLCVANRVGDDRQQGLLEVAVHASWVADLAPTSNVAVCARCRVLTWQTNGLNIFVELSWFRQFEKRDVILELAAVVGWMFDDSLDLDVYLAAVLPIPVVFADSDFEDAWPVL